MLQSASSPLTPAASTHIEPAKFNASYTGLRSDVINLLLEQKQQFGHVLDVGCATGEVGRYMKDRFGASVDGVEIMPDMAEVARTKLDRVFAMSAEAFMETAAHDVAYDAIILSDVLEHTADPWGLLRYFHDRLAPGGIIMISLPNIRHWSTIFNLAVRGDWPHRDRGIHDRTHLRFFTLRTMRALIAQAALRPVAMRRNLRIDEGFSRINRWSRFTNLPGVRAFFTFQYIFACAATDPSSGH